MRKSSYISGEPYKGVVHTKSAYADYSIDLSFLDRYDNGEYKSMNADRIGYLREKELALYKQYGCNNYEEFRDTIREVFMNNNAVEAMRNYSNSVLRKKLEVFSSEYNELWNKNVILDFDFSALNKVDLNFNAQLKAGAAEHQHFEGVFNTSKIKEELNSIFTKHRYKTESDYRDAVNKMMKNLVTANAVSIQVESGSSDSGSSQYRVFNNSTIPNFPWGVKLEDIELARASGQSSQLYQELLRAINRIKNFVIYDLSEGADIKTKDGVRNLVREAAAEAWKDTMDKKGYTDELGMFSLFKGNTSSTFKSAVAGNLGEFQMVVIDKFLHLANSLFPEAGANLLGNEVSDTGEKPHTDVELFQSIGVQVKNFDIRNDGTMREIQTTMYPKKFAQYFVEEGGSSQFTTGFYDFIANYYFNLDYQSKHQDDYTRLIDFLKYNYGEMANFTMSREVSDTFSFYLISGQYLVPASEILEATQSEASGVLADVYLTSSFLGKTDYQYGYDLVESKGTKKTGGESTFNHPDAYNYWKRTRMHISGWKPYKENASTYETLISRRIQLRSKLNLSRLMLWFSILDK